MDNANVTVTIDARNLDEVKAEVELLREVERHAREALELVGGPLRVALGRLDALRAQR